MKKTTFNKTLFQEEQNFSNPGLWIFVAVVFTFVLAPTTLTIYNQAILNKPVGEESTSTSGLIVMVILFTMMLLGTIVLFKKMKLLTQVRSEGLFYRYPPFIIKWNSIKKEEIGTYELRKYKPIHEYSGWGIRNNWSKSGRAFNVSGNIGLQLYLKNGKKVLFGTKRGDAMLHAMHKMMKRE